MRNHFLKTIIAVSCLVGCTACFDLQENLFLKKDGSGNFSFIIHLGEFKNMMNLFGDSENEGEKGTLTLNKSPKDKLNTAFEITKAKLLATNGISNVKAIEDTIQYAFGVSFDFKNIEVLNKALNRLFEDDSADADTKETVYFEWKNNQLTRLDVLDSKSIIGKTTSLSGGSNTGGLFNLDKLFETVSYSTHYQFESKINNTNNSNAMLSPDLKKVSVTCYPFAAADSTQQKCSIANTITLK